MAENTIEIPITTETAANLKRAIQTLKDAYIRHASQQITNNESAILPVLLPQLDGLKQDVVSSKDMIDKYNKLTLDDYKDEDMNDLELGAMSDLDGLSGNTPMTPSLMKQIKKDVALATSNAQSKPATADVEKVGGQFVDTGSNAFQDNPTNDPGTRNFDTQSEAFVEAGGPQNFNNTQTFTLKRGGQNRGELLSQCIPCDFRKFNLDELDPFQDLLDILENELLRRYQRLMGLFKSLLSNNDIRDDLCNLLNFLQFQCLPDLAGIVSLLGMLSMKLMDLKLLNFKGAFMAFLSPFFMPIANGINELLDKYIQLIMGPIDCVLDSLDTQLAKLDINSAVDQVVRARVTDINTRRSFLERKRSALIERKKFLTETDDNGDYRNQPNEYKVVDRRGVQSAKLKKGLTGVANSAADFVGFDDPFPDQTNVDPAAQRRERNVAVKSGEGQQGAILFDAVNVPTAVTREEELRKIDEELNEISGEDGRGGQIGDLTREYEQLKSENPALGGLKTATDFISDSRKDLRDFRSALGSSLQSMRNYIVEGKNMINDTAEVWRKELARMIFGRAVSTEEMLAGAADLQRIARIIGLVRAVMELAKTGKLCDNERDVSAALGSYLIANRAGDVSNNTPNVARGRDDQGNEVLVITTSDAVLDLGGDNETAKLDALDEISALNAQGVAPDIGTLPENLTATDPNLGQVPVAIVPFNLCGDLSKATETDLANIKTWASMLGQ